MTCTARVLACGLVLLSPAAVGQQADAAADPTLLDRVQVVGQRVALQAFPGAVDVVDGDTLRGAQRKVSLAEALVRVPGLSVLERQNFAQDLQIQSRGYGARSTFGIRGIHLSVEGVPGSALDGQGQAASMPLGLLDRIEVLRGPLALQHGNASGGVILGHVDLAADAGVRGSVDAWAGNDASHRAALRMDGASADGRWRWRGLGSHFVTDGARSHAAAERSQFSAVAEWSPRDGERLRIAFDQLQQPETEDPLGLTPAQWVADPHGTDPVALRFDTRKRIGNRQLGARWSREFSSGGEAWLSGYAVQREVLQFLSIPPAAQAAASSAGGVIDLGRSEAGVELGHRWHWSRASLAVGADVGQLDEVRRGFENFVGAREGVRGRLRRDERNRLASQQWHVLGQWQPAADWSVLGGARQARTRIRSQDRYLANGDDGGHLRDAQWAASLGVARAFAHGEIFASIGRGFETPTITELAYRADGSAGLNAALRASQNRSMELGARWREGSMQASVALYRITARDEIVAATTSGGRSSFTNAGRTQREGVEASLEGDWGRGWGYALSANWIRARFTEGFSYRSGGNLVQVAAGNTVPGIPRAEAWAELRWRAPADDIGIALELRGNGRIHVDDRNSTTAPGSLRLALHGDWRMGARWRGFARVDNLANRDYVGSVIVNDGNQRWFEPGAGRGFTLGVSRDFGITN